MTMATRTSVAAVRTLNRLFLCGGIVLGVALGAGVARAQTGDMRPLFDRMDRLERDLNLLQRQVYRGSVEGGELAVPEAESGTAASGNAVTGMEVRINQLESEMRALTGRVEESNHKVDQLKDRLDKLVTDVDNRLAVLEQEAAKNKALAAAQPTAPAQQGVAAETPGTVPTAAPTEGVLPNPPAPGAGSAQAVAVTAPGPAPLPTGTPLEQYQHARALLAQANYAAAESSLRSFITAYPNDELTENAQYWLGETYYVRSDYKNAAIAFAEGYQKFPGGSKAADNLLKLGMSLANLGEKEQACKTFAEIDKKFPQADANIRERAANERQQRGCK